MSGDETKTINKLSEALNTLIISYENLQKENNRLERVIKTIEEEKEVLKQKNDTLQEDVNSLSNSSQQQDSSMDNMLNKIESLLDGKVDETTQNDNKSEVIYDKEVNNKQTDVLSLIDEKEQEEITSKDDKIDLNRMASLLNGFNK